MEHANQSQQNIVTDLTDHLVIQGELVKPEKVLYDDNKITIDYVVFGTYSCPVSAVSYLAPEF